MSDLSITHHLPPHQSNSFAWYGPSMSQQSDEWIIWLTSTDLIELEQALNDFTVSGKNVASMTQTDFPLPNLGPKLLLMTKDLIHGRGFALIRGLVLNQYSEQDLGILFFGIGTYIGRARSQNAAGHLLGHVLDLGKSSKDPTVRVYQTNERQTFHTDSCDVVGLLCLKDAKVGGLSLLASSTTLFNEMRQQRPDLLQLLMEPMATDRRGEIPTGELPYYLIPVFTFYEGYLTCIYQRQYIESAQRFEDAPRLTDKHIEALNMFDDLVNSPELHFSMKLEPGDMQFVYNHAMLHDRTAFTDWDEISDRRHLFRLWLSVPDDRPLAPIFASRFGSVQVGERGGIIVADTKLHIPKSGR